MRKNQKYVVTLLLGEKSRKEILLETEREDEPEPRLSRLGILLGMFCAYRQTSLGIRSVLSGIEKVQETKLEAIVIYWNRKPDDDEIRNFTRAYESFKLISGGFRIKSGVIVGVSHVFDEEVNNAAIR